MLSSVSSVSSSPDSIGGGRDDTIGKRSLDLEILNLEFDRLRLPDLSGDVSREAGFEAVLGRASEADCRREVGSEPLKDLAVSQSCTGWRRTFGSSQILIQHIEEAPLMAAGVMLGGFKDSDIGEDAADLIVES